jgi:hypothetical protein
MTLCNSFLSKNERITTASPKNIKIKLFQSLKIPVKGEAIIEIKKTQRCN